MRASIDPGLDPAAYSYVHELRVRFAETDAMGVVHHAAYLPYLEEARVAYLRAKGRPYGEIRAGGTDIAVVEVHVRYRVALRFDDVVEGARAARRAVRIDFSDRVPAGGRRGRRGDRGDGPRVRRRRPPGARDGSTAGSPSSRATAG